MNTRTAPSDVISTTVCFIDDTVCQSFQPSSSATLQLMTAEIFPVNCRFRFRVELALTRTTLLTSWWGRLVARWARMTSLSLIDIGQVATRGIYVAAAADTTEMRCTRWERSIHQSWQRELIQQQTRTVCKFVFILSELAALAASVNWPCSHLDYTFYRP